MAETTITVRTGENTAEALAQYYKTKSAGAIRAVEGFVQIRKYTLHELKGIFTKEELTAMVDSQNGTMLVPDYQANKGVFLAHLEDAEMLESAFSRHKANWDIAKAKIEKLTAAQIFFLQDEIDLFWESGAELESFFTKYI